MILALLLALLGFPITDVDADALRSTAPTYLTLETARDHLAAARVAGAAHGIDPDLLLSIAWHESRYDVASSNRKEPGGKVSCGVMTPIPMRRDHASKRCPEVTTSLIAGYLDGARHLRGWLRATGHQRVALLGYAGGYVGIKHCGAPWNARDDYRCHTPEVFTGRARWIRSARARARREIFTI
jgi:soluble lytic murein transglycosylase-like protein